MEFNSEAFKKEQDQLSANDTKPQAWRVEDENNVTEDNLEKGFLNTDKDHKPVQEGEGAGGENFGKNNNTPAGDDKNNPSQYGGYDNAYFARTEPSEEHPEDNNFKVKDQEGAPDYDKAQIPSNSADQDPKQEKSERGNGENDRPHEENTYQQGTADNDGINNPGPEELPDQQKVGEDVDDETFKRDHNEE